MTEITRFVTATCETIQDPTIGGVRISVVSRAVIPGSASSRTLRNLCFEFPMNPLRDLNSTEHAYEFFSRKLASYSSWLHSRAREELARKMVVHALPILRGARWRVGLAMTVRCVEMIETTDQVAILDGVVIPEEPSRPSGLSRGQISRLKKEQFRSGEGESESCSVCLDEFSDGAVITQLSPCSHRFHNKCIVRWLRSNRTCPMCRAVCKV